MTHPSEPMTPADPSAGHDSDGDLEQLAQTIAAARVLVGGEGRMYADAAGTLPFGEPDDHEVLAIARTILSSPWLAERDLVAMLHAQREWSSETFAPGDRTEGVLAHIRQELIEVEDAPDDVTEWIDVVILAFEGAWRAGHEPEEIVAALRAKYAKNRARTWPDWRTAEPGTPINHVRTSTEGAGNPDSHEWLGANR